MAAIPKEVTDQARRSSSLSRGNLSHGRGGAGNIGTSDADLNPVTLETPTLKGEMYTTGRGGSGNMAKNDDPVAARRAQDVEGVPRRESTSAAHVGRGGAANIFTPTTADEIAAAASSKKANESAIITDAASSSSRPSSSKSDNEPGPGPGLGLGPGQQAAKKTQLDTPTAAPVGWADKGKEWLFNLGKKKGGGPA